MAQLTNQRMDHGTIKQQPVALPANLDGDFALGLRTRPKSDERPDYARGQESKAPLIEGPDFARGQRTLPVAPEGPDYARGLRHTGQ